MHRYLIFCELESCNLCIALLTLLLKEPINFEWNENSNFKQFDFIHIFGSSHHIATTSVMGKKKSLCIELRLLILQLKQNGASNRELGRQFGCSEKAVRDLLKRVSETGTVQDRPRSGRPPSVRETTTGNRAKLCERPEKDSSRPQVWLTEVWRPRYLPDNCTPNLETVWASRLCCA